MDKRPIALKCLINKLPHGQKAYCSKMPNKQTALWTKGVLL